MVDKNEKPAMDKAERNKLIKRIVIAVMFIGTVIAYVFAPQLFGENSIFNRTISEHTFVNTLYQKIPAMIRSVQIITVAIVLALCLRWVMNKGFARSQRAITITKLINSFIKWIFGLIVLLAILGAWGVDTGTLWASAGILTLVIGLGAQSLVADIVAGVFIVIEGEIQVGDIIIINGWRGTVKEIGIRTTKIVDPGGNVNIVNNSDVTSVINQTQAISLAKCYISIEYGESIPRVEEAIRSNLKRVKERIPAIIDGPFYKGVAELGNSSVVLLIAANCKEEDIYQVQRDMNREYKLIFDENGVNIPFPQVVLNYRDAKKAEAVEVAAAEVGATAEKDAAAFTAEETGE